jgi:acyl-CoA oxidase
VSGATEAIVFLVPGQGGDPRGALLDLHRCGDKFASAIDEVSAEIDAVGAEHGLAPVGSILLTESRPPLAPGMPQLAAYAASVILARILEDAGARPECVVGQSFGEIAALACAGAYTVADGARAVCALNDAFSSVIGLGGMVLLRASRAETEALLRRVERTDLVVACIDSPEETIVSGPLDAIDALFEVSAARDGLPQPLRLAVPYASHHPDLAPVARRFRENLEPLRQKPLIHPVRSPVRRRAYTDSDDLRVALSECVTGPVHLQETIESLATPGGRLFVEVGVGAALCRCVRATVPGARTLAPLTDPAAAREALRPLIP